MKKTKISYMEKEKMQIRIQKKRPKKNAKTYRIETLQDILKAVNQKNIKKFMREFEMVLQMNLLVQSLVEAGKEDGKIAKDSEPVTMSHFDWIDD